MSIPKTTIIIGAGANKEIHPGIGVGSELLKEITERVTDKTSPNSPYLSNAFIKYLPDLDFEARFHFLEHLERYIKLSKSPSIDSFIYEVQSYPEYEKYRSKYIDIARVMIIAQVLGWEGKETLIKIVEEFDRSKEDKQTWFSILTDYLHANKLFRTNYYF